MATDRLPTAEMRLGELRYELATMGKYAAKSTVPIDVLVVGDHPCAHLAAALLMQKSKLRVVLASLQDREPEDRLVTVNPALINLCPLLGGLKRAMKSTPCHGLQFLADKPEVASEAYAKSAFVHVASYTEVHQQIAKLASSENYEIVDGQSIQVESVDEHGLAVTIGKHHLQPRAIVVAVDLPREQKVMLGIPTSWGPDIVHRFTFAKCPAGKHFAPSEKKLMPMSLDLCGKLCWGWLLPGDGEFQLMVEQPIEETTPTSGTDLLAHWVKVLQQHGVLGGDFRYSASAIKTMDRPLTGALEHEGVANRTLLIGPAGGFYSACGEDIYPACWSSIFAADVLKKALKEPHLQDALNPYRQKWRTTLGNYLRGPHQNLRFLLPLVYRNPAMTSRITEAILLSKNVVR